MATIFDMIEVTSVTANTTYSAANGNLLGLVDGMSGSSLDDGEFDIGDTVTIGGLSYSIDGISEPDSNGTFLLGDGTTRTFSADSESNLQVVFLTVSRGGEVRHFIVPNDSYGNFNLQSITTGSIGNVAGSDAAIISTTDNDIAIVCFTPGTSIAVEGNRQVAIEKLKRGDRVMTADHGCKPIGWIGKRNVTRGQLEHHPDLRPIRIAAGALGHGIPQRSICLSPQHRVLVRSRIAERMFSEPEVLVAAKHLVGLPGVEVVAEAPGVTYFHLLLDSHEIVFADGLACESLFLGDQSLLALPPEARTEIRHLFPELLEGRCAMTPSRYVVPGRRGRRLAQRIGKNGKANAVQAGLMAPFRCGPSSLSHSRTG